MLPPGGEGNQGGGVGYPGTGCPPGGNLSRGQDKLGHRPRFTNPSSNETRSNETLIIFFMQVKSAQTLE